MVSQKHVVQQRNVAINEMRERNGWMWPEIANIATQSSHRMGEMNGREGQSFPWLWSVRIAKIVRKRANRKERTLIAILTAIYTLERFTSAS